MLDAYEGGLHRVDRTYFDEGKEKALIVRNILIKIDRSKLECLFYYYSKTNLSEALFISETSVVNIFNNLGIDKISMLVTCPNCGKIQNYNPRDIHNINESPKKKCIRCDKYFYIDKDHVKILKSKSQKIIKLYNYIKKVAKDELIAYGAHLTNKQISYNDI